MYVTVGTEIYTPSEFSILDVVLRGGLEGDTQRVSADDAVLEQVVGDGWDGPSVREHRSCTTSNI